MLGCCVLQQTVLDVNMAPELYSTIITLSKKHPFMDRN